MTVKNRIATLLPSIGYVILARDIPIDHEGSHLLCGLFLKSRCSPQPAQPGDGGQPQGFVPTSPGPAGPRLLAFTEVSTALPQ